MGDRVTSQRNVLSVCAVAVLCAALSAVLWGADTREPAAAQGDRVRFAVIGDFGYPGKPVGEVAALVRGWEPDVVITTGDNNYPAGEASTIDANIGQYYAPFIGEYKGEFGTGAAANRFFPSLGNHDWQTDGASPYLDYFTLPGNERYYDFTAGPVQFFALDSDPHEPDGRTEESRQAEWLRSRLSGSIARWRVVYMHHPPYSSGVHGNTVVMQWPYEAWGATVVMGGHDHSYERLQIGGIPYFVNGVGGAPTYGFLTRVKGSRTRIWGEHGAMLVEANPNVITYRYFNTLGEQRDTYRQCHESSWRPGTESCLAGAWGGRGR
jgi:hypothetical protein